jgi:hypothetical protein
MRCNWSVAVSLVMAPAVHQGCAHGFVVGLFVYKSRVQPIGYRKARAMASVYLEMKGDTRLPSPARRLELYPVDPAVHDWAVHAPVCSFLNEAVLDPASNAH